MALTQVGFEMDEDILARRLAVAGILEMIANRAPLQRVLDVLVLAFEDLADGMIASVLLIEDGKVYHCSAPHLPASWIRVVNGEPIGPNRGSCGTAAWLKQPVVVEDIATDERWSLYRDAALREGLRACWSIPIFAPDLTVLGTFALYYREPRSPTPALLALAEQASHIASIAIQHAQAGLNARLFEEALHATRRHIQLVYDHVDDVLFELSVEGDTFRVLTVNPALLRATGLRSEQVVGRFVTEVIPEPSLSLVLAKYREAVATKQTVRWQESTPYATGTRHGEVAVTPVLDDRGVARYLIGSVRDLTDWRRVEEDVRQLQRLESIGRLSSGVAHDFNNVLNMIMGLGELLIDDLPDESHRAQVREMIAAAERGARLTRQLLAFGGRQALRPEQVSPADAVRQIEPMLRRLLPQDIALSTALAGDAGMVRVDPGQLDQVLLNLAINARDAQPRGGSIRIGVRNAMRGERAGVALSVADDGHGMDEETRRKVFEPFFTTKAPGQGTGLGLATVYGIVKQSGGDIEVTSAPGSGATFTVFLPRA